MHVRYLQQVIGDGRVAAAEDADEGDGRGAGPRPNRQRGEHIFNCHFISIYLSLMILTKIT